MPGINKVRKPGAKVWFINAPMGKNKIGTIMSTLAEKAGIAGRMVNHSARSSVSSSEKCLSVCSKKLRRSGLDTAKPYPPILSCDIVKMFDTGTLSMDNLLALQRLVYFYIAFYLCRRGRENLRDLKGKVFELYCSKINTRKCSFLFQRVNVKYSADSGSRPWYYPQPLGRNKIGAMMKKICAAASLSKACTNHSVRVTSIQVIDEAGFDTREGGAQEMREKAGSNTTAGPLASLLDPVLQ
ncbi:PREDICTED: uncharacterized protein LOC109479505 [Branchiostoma belcheri]|uniref:Uncharacterized protein LOC109479505 n=1 Tax=Branchiostoma belcheri TaxID=7741 RepID=A0A6P4ZSF7_BRABE|nr:PREDICTED: uncharacterized protein LOC109479505 [Branchiostoma belcheri]